MKRLTPLTGLLFLLVFSGCRPQAKDGFSFEVTLSEDAFADIDSLGLQKPVDGRLFVDDSQDDADVRGSPLDCRGAAWAIPSAGAPPNPPE